MPKAVSQNIDDILTSEQKVDLADQGLADLYFLAIPRQTLEVLNSKASERGLTLAQALAQAVDDWLKGEND